MFEKILDWFEAAVTGNRVLAAVIFCALVILLLALIILASVFSRKARRLRKALVAVLMGGDGAREEAAVEDNARGDETADEAGAAESEGRESSGAEDMGTEENAPEYDAQEESGAAEDEWPEDDGQEYEFEITDEGYAEDGEALYTDTESGGEALDIKAAAGLGAGGFKIKVKYDRPKCSWIILGEGSSRALRRVKTKDEAIRVAKEICQKRQAALSLHKKDGKFQKHNFHIRNAKTQGRKEK